MYDMEYQGATVMPTTLTGQGKGFCETSETGENYGVILIKDGKNG